MATNLSLRACGPFTSELQSRTAPAPSVTWRSRTLLSIAAFEVLKVLASLIERLD
jgi:hypothetical protein